MLTVLTVVLLVGGCLPQTGVFSSSASPSDSSTPATAVANSPDANLPQLKGKATIALVVKGETVTIEVDGTNAPVTAGNFVDLVQRGIYNGLAFHRVIRQPQPFVAQGGDPQSKNPDVPIDQLGTGSFIDPATANPRFVPLEITPQNADRPVYHQTFDTAGINVKPKLRHTRGAVAMARSSAPDSASAQFYIALADLDFLDGNYAVFGYVTEGMDAVDKIKQGDRIESAKVVAGLENLKQPAKA